MSRHVLVLVCVLSVSTLDASGQENTDSLKTFVLREVFIHEDRLKASEIGLTATSIDHVVLTQARGSNFSELMRMTGAGQIRSYGPSGLSTPSFRGTGGSHTSILWNGVSLQSPLSGQQDLSLIPVSFVEDIKLQKGGATSLYGSGAIGGSIQLNNKTCLNKGLDLGSTQKLGSFGNHYHEYRFHWSSRRLGTSFRVFQRKLANTFPYTNSYVRPQTNERRSHAAVMQRGLLQQNDWLVNRNHVLSFKLWYQDNEIEMPGSIIAGDGSESTQKDEFFRSLVSWNLDKSDFSLGYKQAYVRHVLNFVDPSTGINSTSIFKSWTNRADAEFDLSSFLVLVSGFTHTYDQTEVDAFGISDPDRNNTAFFSSLRYRSSENRFLIALNIRQELTDGDLTPISSSIGGEYALSQRLKLGANASRNYRIPTLNDLYWNGEGGIGNPNLLPETSWSNEFTLGYANATQSFATKATGYSTVVSNWILWRPITSAVWTPDNVKQVWSRGVEATFSGFVPFKSIPLEWNVTYNFTKATNRKASDLGNVIEIDKQLFYTPVHDGTVYLKVSYQNLDWTLIHNYIGKQYTDGENSEFFALPSYHILSAYLSRYLHLAPFSGHLRFEVNNLLNTNYENRRGYPLYGRNYSITLNIQFNNNKNDD